MRSFVTRNAINALINRCYLLHRGRLARRGNERDTAAYAMAVTSEITASTMEAQVLVNADVVFRFL